MQGFPGLAEAGIQRPSQVISIAEWDRCNAGPPCGPVGFYGGGATAWWAVCRIHNGGSNLAFADGHAKWLRPEKFHSTTDHMESDGTLVPADATAVAEGVWRTYWDPAYNG